MRAVGARVGKTKHKLNNERTVTNIKMTDREGKEKPSKDQAFDLSNSPIHLLHRAGQCAGDVFLAEMSDSDLTPRQLAVLASVAQNEGLSQTQLVAMTGIDRSTLADIVRRMLKKGFLQRRRAKQDARAYSVKLTDEGRKVLDLAQPVARRIDARILEVLPVPEREKFMDDLSLIVDELSNVHKNQRDGSES